MTNFSIVRIAGIHYSAVSDDLLTIHRDFASLNYTRQQESLFSQFYVYGGSFSRAMGLLGHEANEIVYDFDIMQRTWAEEKMVYYDPAHFRLAIMLAQIAHLRPDVLYFQDIYSMPLDIRRNLKTIFPFLKLIIVFRGYPGGDRDYLVKELGFADIILVGSPILINKLKESGLVTHLCYHSFDTDILNVCALADVFQVSQCEFTFLGSTGSFGGPHQSRYLFLKELMRDTPLRLWADVSPSERESERGKTNSRSIFKVARSFCKKLLEIAPDRMVKSVSKNEGLPKKIRNVATEIVEERRASFWAMDASVHKPLSEIYPNRVHAPLFGLKFYGLLGRSAITLNIHSDAAKGFVDNMRLFQATGMGACLLTDTGQNMGDIFEADSEVCEYVNIEECKEKTRYLLDHPDVAAAIGKAGQRRTIQAHNTMNRCEQISELILQNLKCFSGLSR